MNIWLKDKLNMLNGVSSSLLILAIWLFAGLFNNSNASTLEAPTVKIAVNNIGGLLEENRNDLPYNRILTAINDNTSFGITLYFDYARRAAANFNYKITDCLFPANLVVNAFPDEAKIESVPINTAKAYFISEQLIDAKTIVTDRSKNYIISFKRGNTFGANIKRLEHHRLIPVTTDAQAAKMLVRDRIDIMLAYLPDSLSILLSDEYKHLQYDENSLFYSQTDNILCHQTPKNEAFLLEVNKQIASMKSSGELRDILDKAFVK